MKMKLTFFFSFLNSLLKTSTIFVNDSWPNSEVEPADIELPDALSSLTICFVGKDRILMIFLNGLEQNMETVK